MVLLENCRGKDTELQQFLSLTDPKMFMWIVAIALIHTCQQIKRFSLLFCTNCRLLSKVRRNPSHRCVQERNLFYGLASNKCQINGQISVSLKVRV